MSIYAEGRSFDYEGIVLGAGEVMSAGMSRHALSSRAPHSLGPKAVWRRVLHDLTQAPEHSRLAPVTRQGAQQGQ